MNRSPDVELVLRDYFADDGSIAPDYVLDVVEERIMRQPQKRAWRVVRRDAHVNSYLKPLLAVAAVVVIAFAGIALLGQPSDSGVGDATSPAPSPSPIASTSPSTAPSAGAMLPPWYPNPDSSGAGILAAGSHTTKSFNPAFSFSVPEGWVNDNDDVGFYSLFPDTPANEAEFALSGNLAHSIYGGPRNDPWFICEPFGQGLGDTSAEIVASLMANEALVTEQGVRTFEEHQRFLLWYEFKLAGVRGVIESDGEDRPWLDRRQPHDFVVGDGPAVVEPQAGAVGGGHVSIAAEHHARPLHRRVSATSPSSGTS